MGFSGEAYTRAQKDTHRPPAMKKPTMRAMAMRSFMAPNVGGEPRGR